MVVETYHLNKVEIVAAQINAYFLKLNLDKDNVFEKM
jgi:hypothetical protein